MTYFNTSTIDNVTGTIQIVAGVINTPGQAESSVGPFAIITLTTGTRGRTSPLNLSNLVVGDINGQAVDMGVISGQVTINQSEDSGGGGGGQTCPPRMKERSFF